MNWQGVCRKPELQDLQYRIELNGLGQIVMTPTSNEHSFRQSRVMKEMMSRMGTGLVLPGCAMETNDGTKVADVAWLSDGFYSEHGLASPYPTVPEICIEVLAPANTSEEMDNKRSLYFANGAKEVWFCLEGGRMEFFSFLGKLDKSDLVPEFPVEV